jgi:hypothetical protein
MRRIRSLAPTPGVDSAQYLTLEANQDTSAVAADVERRKIAARLIPPHPHTRAGGKNVLLMTTTNRGTFLRLLNTILLTHIDYLRQIGGHAPGWRVSKTQITSQDEEGRLNRQAKGLTDEDKALPPVVFDQLVAHLDLLGADSIPRNAVELLMHLGRRPEDLMNFPFNCVAAVTDVINGEERTYPRLRYTDRIKDGKGGHLVDIPVFDRAAAVMRRQQDWLRRTYPQWFDEAGKPLNADLRLWPKSTNNRDGTDALLLFHARAGARADLGLWAPGTGYRCGHHRRRPGYPGFAADAVAELAGAGAGSAPGPALLRSDTDPQSRRVRLAGLPRPTPVVGVGRHRRAAGGGTGRRGPAQDPAGSPVGKRASLARAGHHIGLGLAHLALAPQMTFRPAEMGRRRKGAPPGRARTR